MFYENVNHNHVKNVIALDYVDDQQGTIVIHNAQKRLVRIWQLRWWRYSSQYSSALFLIISRPYDH